MDRDKIPNSNRTRPGFTLIETLLASVILGAAALTIIAGANRYLSQTRYNRIYEEALLTADKQLILIDAMGVENFLAERLKTGVTEGKYSRYDWLVDIRPSELRGLYDTRITISWPQTGRSQNFSINTRLIAIEN